jgi:hypothetical protein
MAFPAFAINPSDMSGDPTFLYTEYKVVACSNRYGIGETHGANLSINSLPAFACLQRGILEQQLGVKGTQATEGVDLVIYEVPGNDQRAAALQFIFRAGAPCALSAEIQQNYRMGYRYQWAAPKWQTCSDEANRQFCTANGTFTWSDGGKLNTMKEAAIKVCGTMAFQYSRKPTSGPFPQSARVYTSIRTALARRESAAQDDQPWCAVLNKSCGDPQ